MAATVQSEEEHERHANAFFPEKNFQQLNDYIKQSYLENCIDAIDYEICYIFQNEMRQSKFSVLYINPPTYLLPTVSAEYNTQTVFVLFTKVEHYNKMNQQFNSLKNQPANVSLAMLSLESLPQKSTISNVVIFGVVQEYFLEAVQDLLVVGGQVVTVTKSAINWYELVVSQIPGKSLYKGRLNGVRDCTVHKNSIKQYLDKNCQNLNYVFHQLCLSKKKQDSSQQSSKNEINIKLYECPVCMLTMRPPTTLCFNGHTVCWTCKPSLDKCPICRTDFSIIQNIIFDEILEKMKVSCSAAHLGCTVMLPYNFQDIHVTNCKFLKSVNCSLCSERILETEYNQHIEKIHVADIVHVSMFPKNLNINDFLEKQKKEEVVIVVKEVVTQEFFEIHVEKSLGVQVATKHLGRMEVTATYEVVYTVIQDQFSYSVAKMLYSSNLDTDAMFETPHLNLADNFGPHCLHVCLRKKEDTTLKAENKFVFKAVKRILSNVFFALSYFQIDLKLPLISNSNLC